MVMKLSSEMLLYFLCLVGIWGVGIDPLMGEAGRRGGHWEVK